MADRKNWTFSDYMEELVYLDELAGEVPGVYEARLEFVKEIWQRFPQESERVGLIKVP